MGSAYDLGFAINILSVEGQIGGRAMQGLGYTLRDKFVTSKKGVKILIEDGE